MALTVQAEGDAAMTSGGSAVTLATVTDDGVFQLWVDFSTLEHDDVVLVKVTKKVRSGASAIDVINEEIAGVQSSLFFTFPITGVYELVFSLQQTAGATNETCPWAIEKLG